MPTGNSIVTIDLWAKAAQRFRDATHIDLTSVSGLGGLIGPDQVLVLIDDRQKSFKAYRKQKAVLQSSLKSLLAVVEKIIPLIPIAEMVSANYTHNICYT